MDDEFSTNSAAFSALSSENHSDCHHQKPEQEQEQELQQTRSTDLEEGIEAVQVSACERMERDVKAGISGTKIVHSVENCAQEVGRCIQGLHDIAKSRALAAKDEGVDVDEEEELNDDDKKFILEETRIKGAAQSEIKEKVSVPFPAKRLLRQRISKSFIRPPVIHTRRISESEIESGSDFGSSHTLSETSDTTTISTTSSSSSSTSTVSYMDLVSDSTKVPAKIEIIVGTPVKRVSRDKPPATTLVVASSSSSSTSRPATPVVYYKIYTCPFDGCKSEFAGTKGIEVNFPAFLHKKEGTHILILLYFFLFFLQEHRSIIHSTGLFPCPHATCVSTFKSWKGFEGHVFTHHKDKSWSRKVFGARLSGKRDCNNDAIIVSTVRKTTTSTATAKKGLGSANESTRKSLRNGHGY